LVADGVATTGRHRTDATLSKKDLIMTTLSIQAHTLTRSFQPLGARVAAGLFSRLLSAFTASVSPSEAQSRADEAEHVRSLARRMQATDPGFAADLYAAAARHEGLDD